MHFKIISVGGDCLPFIERTLSSILSQSHEDYEVMIVDDCPADPAEADFIRDWVAARNSAGDLRFKYHITTEKLWQVRNQVEAIRRSNPDPEDVIVWLDLDGDQFAHRDVLKHLVNYYSDNTLVTYGSYRPVPEVKTVTMASRVPSHIIESNSLRRFVLAGNCPFNHLRTMKARVFNSIPEDRFKFKSGEWYTGGTDYVIMIPAMELAGRRQKFIAEVLCLYNHANPLADYLTRAKFSDDSAMDAIRRPPLKPLHPRNNANVRNVMNETEIYLPADQRRSVLREYGRLWNLNVFIETGTNNGDTPYELREDFSRIFTIELGTRQWNEARRRLRSLSHIQCLHGDSSKVLPTILANLEEPALVWLDGHYSGPGTARGSTDTPVRQELEILFEDVSRGARHVIMVDDARLFRGGLAWTEEFKDYPSIDWVKEIAFSHGYDFELTDDIMRLTPHV